MANTDLEVVIRTPGIASFSGPDAANIVRHFVLHLLYAPY